MIQLLHPIAPDKRGPVSQEFGENPQAYAQFGLAGHNGIDWAIPAGTQIRAMLPGVIVYAGLDNYGYGLHVKIDHVGDITRTIYGHFSATNATVGKRVSAGDIIGWSGGARGDPNAGNSTGPHLHAGARGKGGTREFDGYIDFSKYLVEQLDGQTQPPVVTPPAGLSLPGRVRVVNTKGDGLRVRTGPSTSAGVYKTLPDGTVLDGVALTGDWVQVNLPFYMHRSYLEAAK